MKKNIIILLLIISLSITCCISNGNSKEKQTSEDGLYLHNDTYWLYIFTYSRGNWKNHTINDLEFRVIGNNNIILYKVYISEAFPSVLIMGQSKLYPFSLNSTGVLDKETGNIITVESSIKNYVNCYLVFIDQNSDDKASSGDSIFIYKDWNGDGEPDIKENCIFNVYLKNELIVEEKLLQEVAIFHDGLK